ncbi:FG-GAP-like repeat-containing protein, partial [Streptomyces sp. NPDC086777]|uniref:FG-GAP-like repeat-containing protein n=1 Tax=Streptomyces sp. NPDC086777 TaxID=3154866 RepID=UPI00345026E2
MILAILQAGQLPNMEKASHAHDNLKLASEQLPVIAVKSASADSVTFSFDFSGQDQTALRDWVNSELHPDSTGRVNLGALEYDTSTVYASRVPLHPAPPQADLYAAVTLANGKLQFVLDKPQIDATKLPAVQAYVAAFFIGLAIGAVFYIGCTAALPGAVAICNVVGGAAMGFATAAFGAILSGQAQLGSWFYDGIAGAIAGALTSLGSVGLEFVFLDGALVRGWLSAAKGIIVDTFNSVVNWWNIAAWPAVVTFITVAIPSVAANICTWIARVLHLGSAKLPPNKVTLLPLGDSITYGYGSTSGDGYRAQLWKLMNDEGETPTFVGSQSSGQMSQPNHEGYPGWRIDQISGITSAALSKYHPTVVTLHAGTNDMNQNYDVAGAPARFDALVGKILTEDPGVTVIASILVPSQDPAVEARIEEFNRQIVDLMDVRIAEGQKIWVAGMGEIDPAADLSDALHPNDNGYLKMAASFNDGIYAAAVQGWLVPPLAGTPGNGGGAGQPAGCSTGSGGWSASGQVAGGVGQPASKVRFADYNGDGKADYWVFNDDGSVQVWLNNGSPNSWTSLGQVAGGVGQPASKVRFADYNGDGKADYWVLNDDGSAQVWLNNGSPNSWTSLGQVAGGIGRSSSGVLLADFNGDGRADYLYVNADSSVEVWINTGIGGWSAQGKLAGGVGQPGARVRFADMNCDKRADYVVVTKSGSLWVWLNTTSGWQALGLYAAGVGRPDSEVQLADYNGDGRADYFGMSRTGAVSAWINVGGGDTSPPGWVAQSQAAAGVGQPGSKIRLADYDGDGFDDYWVLNDDGTVDLWTNAGTPNWTSLGRVAGGIGRTSGGVVLADLNADNRADYLYINSDGSVEAWLNTGTGGWSAQGKIAGGVGQPGSKVRIADYDGDGKADYWVLNDDGSADVWLYGGGTTWTSLGRVAGGIGRTSGGVVLADLNADNRADYLYIN